MCIIEMGIELKTELKLHSEPNANQNLVVFDNISVNFSSQLGSSPSNNFSIRLAWLLSPHHNFQSCGLFI